MAKTGSGIDACGKCGGNHAGRCCDGQTGCFKCVKRVTSWKSALIISKVLVIREVELNLHQLLHQTGLHLEDPLMVLAEGQTVFMQSLATKSKRTLWIFHGYDQSLYFWCLCFIRTRSKFILCNSLCCKSVWDSFLKTLWTLMCFYTCWVVYSSWKSLSWFSCFHQSQEHHG